MGEYAAIEKEAKLFTELCVHNDAIDPNLFDEFGVKRGLRDKDGNGVLAGITNISRIDAFEMRDGVKTPCDGKLWYRGYNVYDLIRGLRGKRYGFEEVAYLLLLGDLPNEQQLHEFTDCLTKCRALPSNFVRDVIMKAPSKDLMNSLTRSVLTLASYDDSVGDNSLQTQMEQCIKLISVFPMLAVYGYHAYNYYLNDGSMYIHRPRPELSAAENLLQMLRPDQPEDSRVLEWIAFASNAFNVMVPFYANVTTTPAYLSNTTGAVSTDNFYWNSRMIAAMADAAYSKSVFHIERYQLAAASAGHANINTYDAKLRREQDASARAALREQANEAMADTIRGLAADTLDKVLYELSCQMKNCYSRSDA